MLLFLKLKNYLISKYVPDRKLASFKFKWYSFVFRFEFDSWNQDFIATIGSTSNFCFDEALANKCNDVPGAISVTITGIHVPCQNDGATNLEFNNVRWNGTQINRVQKFSWEMEAFFFIDQTVKTSKHMELTR